MLVSSACGVKQAIQNTATSLPRKRTKRQHPARENGGAHAAQTGRHLWARSGGNPNVEIVLMLNRRCCPALKKSRPCKMCNHGKPRGLVLPEHRCCIATGHNAGCQEKMNPTKRHVQMLRSHLQMLTAPNKQHSLWAHPPPELQHAKPAPDVPKAVPCLPPSALFCCVAANNLPTSAGAPASRSAGMQSDALTSLS